MSEQEIGAQWLKDGQFHPSPLHNLILKIMEKRGKTTMEMVNAELNRMAICAFSDLKKDGMLLCYDNGISYFDNSSPIAGIFHNSTGINTSYFARGVVKCEISDMEIRVLDLITRNMPCDRKTLMRKFRMLKKPDLDKIMNGLAESGKIEVIKEYPKGKGRPTTYYKMK